MSYLLDTHTLLWSFYKEEQLSDAVRDAIENADELYVSIVTLWEIAIKQSIGKINISNTIQEIADKCYEADVSILPISAVHLDQIRQLPDIHRDPFDRLLISQAITEDLAIITRDTMISLYDVKTIW